MLWVLKRTVLLRRYFWAPKTYVKRMGKKTQFYAQKFCLSWAMDIYSKTCVKRPLKNRKNKDLNDKW